MKIMLTKNTAATYLVFNTATGRIQAECNHPGSPAQLLPDKPDAFREASMTSQDYAAALAALDAPSLVGAVVIKSLADETRVRLRTDKATAEFYAYTGPGALRIGQPIAAAA